MRKFWISRSAASCKCNGSMLSNSNIESANTKRSPLPQEIQIFVGQPRLAKAPDRQTSPLWGPHLLKFPLAGSGMLGGPTTSHIFSIVSLTVINYKTPSEYFLRVSGLPFGDH